MAFVVGFDIGTTSTIGILIELPSRVVAVVKRSVTLSTPHAAWAEEDPAQWWSNLCEISRELIARSGVGPGQIKAVGVAGMLPAVVLLDAEGQLLRPSIQQSDGRAGQEVIDLKAEADEVAFIAKAGNGINQQLVGAKLRWLERHEPEVFSRIHTVLGSYDYINFKLTGERSIDRNWALEAGFVNVQTHELDDDLINFAHIGRCNLPPMHRSEEIVGHISKQASAETGLAVGTPVVAGAADHIASAYAAGVTRPGDILFKFGGAVDVLVSTDIVAPDSRMYLDYHLVPGLYMPNGCMSTGGSGLNWFAANFASSLASSDDHDGLLKTLDRLAGSVAPGSDGLIFLPYFLGEKTPIHDPALRGTLTGLSFTHGVGHVWRALLEGYGYAIAHHVEVFTEMGHSVTNCYVSDGGSSSDVWMQMVSDILQRPLQRLSGHPGSCLGAAWIAAIGAGLEDDWGKVSSFITKSKSFEPNQANAGIYSRGYNKFRDLGRRMSGFVA
ncbi:FGGY-family carbohydrate kinase [Devosia sp. 2618]|uniref:FGGY-family carbohydrate kinase n=1 Tax=Devosia sp. 2618 TaxID=3156454 RepID=UPI003393B03B